MNDGMEHIHRIVAAQHREMSFYEKHIAEANSESNIQTDTATTTTTTASDMELAAPDLGRDPTGRALYPIDPEDLLLPDQHLADKTETAPNDSGMLANNTNSIHVRISEADSPDRVTALANEYGVSPCTAFDVTTNDETGAPWNFDTPAKRARRKQRRLHERPQLHIKSHMCAAIAALQHTN